MQKIELNIENNLFSKIESIAKFLDWDIEACINLILDREIESVHREPKEILERYLNNPAILNLVFKESLVV